MRRRKIQGTEWGIKAEGGPRWGPRGCRIFRSVFQFPSSSLARNPVPPRVSSPLSSPLRLAIFCFLFLRISLPSVCLLCRSTSLFPLSVSTSVLSTWVSLLPVVNGDQGGEKNEGNGKGGKRGEGERGSRTGRYTYDIHACDSQIRLADRSGFVGGASDN